MQKLHPKITWLFFIRRLLILSIFPIFLALYLLSGIPVDGNSNTISYSVIYISVIINVAILIWFIISYAWARISYNFYGFELTDDSFKKTFGVFSKRKTAIPYETIKHIDTRQGLLGGILGLVELHIETWGKAHNRAEEYLPGLTKEMAEKLEGELIRRAHQAKS